MHVPQYRSIWSVIVHVETCIHDLKRVHMDIDNKQHKWKCVSVKDVVDGKSMSQCKQHFQ